MPNLKIISANINKIVRTACTWIRSPDKVSDFINAFNSDGVKLNLTGGDGRLPRRAGAACRTLIVGHKYNDYDNNTSLPTNTPFRPGLSVCLSVWLLKCERREGVLTDVFDLERRRIIHRINEIDAAYIKVDR